MSAATITPRMTGEEFVRKYGGDVIVMPSPEVLVAIEVRGRCERWLEAFRRIVKHLREGVTVAVLVDPLTRSVSVFGEAFGQRMFGPEDTLPLPEVLPGFSVPVRQFFE